MGLGTPRPTGGGRISQKLLHPPCWAGCKTSIFLWAYGP